MCGFRSSTNECSVAHVTVAPRQASVAWHVSLPLLGNECSVAHVASAPRQASVAWHVSLPLLGNECSVAHVASAPRQAPRRAFIAHRGFPPPGDELCVELGSDRWSMGLVPPALRLCGVLW